MAEEFEMIWVVPVEKGKVGAYEAHPAHPDGIAFVYWDALSSEAPDPVWVASTPFIRQRLGLQTIREVSEVKRAAGRKKKETPPSSDEPVTPPAES